ncbi:MAG: HAD family hydrolase [Piscirickettsiaceae bacterium]|nr:HAD family hydrolase [Piscirickettsiaceae bacterium]
MENKLYALDFDGVICDSAVETGITGWKVASQLWPEMPAEIPSEMIDLFRQVRPVMETGYEAILIMRLLFEGTPPQNLLDDFANAIQDIIEQEQLSTDQLKQLFGETRDHWINDDLDDWIAMNPLFDGVADKLRQIDPEQCVIITTKQERFVSHILRANAISLADERIFGLDRKMNKPDIIRNMLNEYPDHTVLFVEDRLPTLIKVIADKRLKKVRLLFANWGYNTQQDKKHARQNTAITTIDLTEFSDL